ncbi:hypothetical protein M8818_006821 [Zalaria obscura]|uniref:Uncharacterized protein n=1 Tax=Zalaria obscura TaxID=2024903 RepID=A0ACC3S6U6_9PEZI
MHKAKRHAPAISVVFLLAVQSQFRPDLLGEAGWYGPCLQSSVHSQGRRPHAEAVRKQPSHTACDRWESHHSGKYYTSLEVRSEMPLCGVIPLRGAMDHCLRPTYCGEAVVG